MPYPVSLTWFAFSVTACAVATSIGLSRSQTGQTPVPIPSPSPSPSPTVPPLLSVSDQQAEPAAVLVDKAEILLQTVGPLAKTTVTLTFRNTTARVLEGELHFPLPDGAALSGYALDVHGEMADAVPVPKEQARVVFETEVRKGIDPGLVEQTQGNNFRTRIYPLPAHGTRTIRLSFVSESVATANERRVSLPLRWNQTVPLLTVRVESDAPATLSLGGSDRPFLAGDMPGSQTKTLENVAVNGDLTLRLQADKSAALRDGLLVESFVKPSGNRETYFAVLEKTPPATGAVPVVRSGRHIGLLWDASLSRRTANIDRELKLLETLAHEKWRDTTVHVLLLRNTSEPGGSFIVRDGNVEALVAFLRAQAFDGGTQFGGAFTTVIKPVVKVDYWLAFTDGLDTLSHSGAMKTDAPVWIVNSDARSNGARLRTVATASGGNYLNLSEAGDAGRQWASAVGESSYCLLRTTVNEGTVEGLTNTGATPVRDADSVAVAGRLVSEAATITLHYGYPGGKETATRTVTVRKPEPAAPSSGLVGRIWAQSSADALSVDPQRNRDSLHQIGREFGIVTPGTSLLVLETLEQCLQYGIAPSRERRSLYAEYVKTVEGQGVARRDEERSRLHEAVARWKDRVDWWSRDFKYAANFRYGKEKKTHDMNEVVVGSGSGAGAAQAELREDAPARPAPAPMSPPAQGTANFYGGPAADRQQSAHGFASSAGRATFMESAKKSAMDTNGVAAAPVATIAIKPWSPKAPYIKKMAAAKTADVAYATYLVERKPWIETPAYYFDCAEELHRRGATALAVRVLTGIADLRLEDAALLRIVAHRLTQWKQIPEAITLFEQIAELRPEEPQSFRDLALALADQGDTLAANAPLQAVTRYNRALALLNKVAVNHWDRFEGISDIAVTEANRIIARAKKLPPGAASQLVIPLDSRLVHNIDCDLRVVMTWDSDNTDMDLHVIEPSGEECYYSHNRTAIGGRMSDDFTQGYGPEEYFVRRGMDGKYRIRTNYFGSREQKITGGTTVQATVFTDWGRPNEKRQSLSLRLTENKETVTIGDVTLGKK